MADILLSTLRDYWKSVSDWVTGMSEDAPKVTLSGSNVSIGGVQFRLVNGDRLVGTAAQRPSASAAASALFPGLFYHAYDTGEVSQTTGSKWRSLGVA